jgi:hypothetical protein
MGSIKVGGAPFGRYAVPSRCYLFVDCLTTFFPIGRRRCPGFSLTFGAAKFKIKLANGTPSEAMKKLIFSVLRVAVMTAILCSLTGCSLFKFHL